MIKIPKNKYSNSPPEMNKKQSIKRIYVRLKNFVKNKYVAWVVINMINDSIQNISIWEHNENNKMKWKIRFLQ